MIDVILLERDDGIKVNSHGHQMLTSVDLTSASVDFTPATVDFTNARVVIFNGGFYSFQRTGPWA